MPPSDEKDFDPASILDSFATMRHFFSKKHTIANALHFNSFDHDPLSYHRRVVIGRLLAITTPKNGAVYGRTVSNKFNKTNQQQAQPSALMLVFGDYFNMPNCFCIFLQRKNQFQLLFGADASRSELVRIGDMFAVKDPKVCENVLGDSIPILKEPKLIVGITPYDWPTHNMSKSLAADWQVFFDQPGKRITVIGPELKQLRLASSCNGFTCDKQSYCQGCFGKCPTRKPIVMECSVQVHDVEQFGVRNFAYVQGFSSLRFTTMFFEDLSTLSQKHTLTIQGLNGDLDEHIDEMIDVINSLCGFTICGWHRQGLTGEDVSGDQLVNAGTMAHFILVQPTDPMVLQTPEFKKLLIKTPTDNTIPQNLPAVTVTPPVLQPTSGPAAKACAKASPALASEIRQKRKKHGNPKQDRSAPKKKSPPVVKEEPGHEHNTRGKGSSWLIDNDQP